MDHSENNAYSLIEHVPCARPCRKHWTHITSLLHCMPTPTLLFFPFVCTEKETDAQTGEVLCLGSHRHSKGRIQTFVFLAGRHCDTVQLKWYSCGRIYWILRDQKVPFNCHKTSPCKFGCVFTWPCHNPLHCGGCPLPIPTLPVHVKSYTKVPLKEILMYSWRESKIVQPLCKMVWWFLT